MYQRFPQSVRISHILAQFMSIKSLFFFRVDMIKRLDGSFKGMWLIGTLRDTIRGAVGKASLPSCDITELIKFSKVKEDGCFKSSLL